MKARGIFVFKSIESKSGGQFTNTKGENIPFKASYQITLDEQTEKGIYTRRFKIPLENENLINSLKELNPYDNIQMDFEVFMYLNQIKIVPFDFEKIN